MISITKTVRCVTKTPDGKEVLKEKEVKLLSFPDKLNMGDEKKLSNRDTLIKIPLALSFLTVGIPGIFNFLIKIDLLDFSKFGEYLFWTLISIFLVCVIIYLYKKVR